MQVTQTVITKEHGPSKYWLTSIGWLVELEDVFDFKHGEDDEIPVVEGNIISSNWCGVTRFNSMGIAENDNSGRSDLCLPVKKEIFETILFFKNFGVHQVYEQGLEDNPKENIKSRFEQ